MYLVDPNVEPDLAVAQPTAQLLYRGAAYALNGWAASATAASQPVKGKASRDTELATVHRHNLHNNLQRRLEAARDKGDQNLINLLERELQQIA